MQIKKIKEFLYRYLFQTIKLYKVDNYQNLWNLLLSLLKPSMKYCRLQSRFIPIIQKWVIFYFTILNYIMGLIMHYQGKNILGKCDLKYLKKHIFIFWD